LPPAVPRGGGLAKVRVACAALPAAALAGAFSVASSSRVLMFHSHTTPGPPAARQASGRGRREATFAHRLGEDAPRAGAPAPTALAPLRGVEKAGTAGAGGDASADAFSTISSSMAHSSPRSSPVAASHSARAPPTAPPATSRCLTCAPGEEPGRGERAMAARLQTSPSAPGMAAHHRRAPSPSLERSHTATPAAPAQATRPPGRGARNLTPSPRSRRVGTGWPE
jgi:hypothetical protein